MSAPYAVIVVAHETECSRDHIFEAYDISTSYVVRLSSSRRSPLLTIIVSIEEKRTILQVGTAKPFLHLGPTARFRSYQLFYRAIRYLLPWKLNLRLRMIPDSNRSLSSTAGPWALSVEAWTILQPAALTLREVSLSCYSLGWKTIHSYGCFSLSIASTCALVLPPSNIVSPSFDVLDPAGLSLLVKHLSSSFRISSLLMVSLRNWSVSLV